MVFLYPPCVINGLFYSVESDHPDDIFSEGINYGAPRCAVFPDILSRYLACMQLTSVLP